jgi:hypothetical protein
VITVFVWSFRGKNEAWGHAALQCGSAYVSWWPANPGQAPSGLSQAAIRAFGQRTPVALRSVYASVPILARRFEHDVRDEGGQPDQRIVLEGMDESAVVEWWRAFSLDEGRAAGPPRPWHTTQLNCSTVVAHALNAAGGDRYAAWFHTWNMVWTPRDVLRYAESIRHGLMRSRLSARSLFRS